MDRTIGLTLNLQLCLAHYCDTHGPTPLMVTEGIPAGCSICLEEPVRTIHGPSQAKQGTQGAGAETDAKSTSAVADAFGNLSLSRGVSVSASEQAPDTQRASLLRSSTAGSSSLASQSASTLETPPDSPRPMFQQPHRESGYRRTYDDTVTKKQGPCDNCAMTLPRRQDKPGNSSEHPIAAGGPTLRTRAPAERVFGNAGQASPPISRSSSDTDGEREHPRKTRAARSGAPASSRTTSCSTNSTSSERPPFHVHYVNYTSTHEPLLPTSFSLLRASCLRALSFETLPRAPSTSHPNASPYQIGNTPSYITSQSAGSAASGGPIFFGDALAGYTTAYIFRIPDVHARGHKRVYSFLALSTHKERLAMKTFSVISTAFRELAIWIQQLAEAEAERTASTSSPVGSVPYGGAAGPNAGTGSGLGGGLGGGFAPAQRPMSTTSVAAVDRSESSFLTGGTGFTRRMGSGAGASAPKARGLAELVGQPDFFIELHRRFVQLLFEVGVALNS